MKGLVVVTLIVLVFGSLAIAQSGAPAGAATVTLRGTIIDNQCAGAQKPEELAAFIKTHTKECALMSVCVASGYSIYSDGKLTKFDKASNAKVEEFLKKADSKLEVVVVAKKAGDMLDLVSIESQK